MTKLENPFDDIPGTIVFDGQRSRQGYHFNMFCTSLKNASNRDAFRADQTGYLAKFSMSEAQRQAVLNRDWNGMLQLGGNIFYITKLAACDGLPPNQMNALMSGMAREDYVQMMLDGGRAIEGNRSKKEQHGG